MNTVRIWILCATVFALAVPASGQYRWYSAFPNLPTFSYPVDLRHAADTTNRLFVVQQKGIIYTFQNDPNVSTRRIFLDISDRVSQGGGETGLLGLAFHPNYAQNGYFYVNYTNTVAGQLKSFIARYRVSADPDSALKNSELILLTLDQPYTNHNGGCLAFGPDGYLYCGFGDGGSGNDPGNRAQDRSVLFGKILRIDVDSPAGGNNYGIPAGNPFRNNGSGWREEIWSYGMRNPWRFSFDPVSGNLWCGDVGQDTREEIDIIAGGGNYGWRLMEGFLCTPIVNPNCLDTAGLLRPVFDYVNGSGNNSNGSITGGYVYRGSSVDLSGAYVYGDYISGRTWALTYDGVNPPTNTQLSDEAFNISTFGVDRDNELYLCSYSGAGRIYRLHGPPAPVELASFAASAAGDLAELTWRTATETNNDGFVVERRTSGPWTARTFIRGAGTSTLPHAYAWTDDISDVMAKVIRYRLRQRDYDGTEELSREAEVDRGAGGVLTFDLYPNPAPASATLRFGTRTGGDAAFGVYDVLGRQLQWSDAGPLPPGSHERSMDLRGLPAGLYIVRLVTADGTMFRRLSVAR